MPGRLCVFLHGLTVIAERRDRFEIAIPDVPGHVYRAGSWLAETTIEPGEWLELRNVTAGNASIYGTNFLLEIPSAYPLTDRHRAATLIVPRPNEVLGLLLATPAIVAGIPSPHAQAEVTVLVYDYDDENEVLLDGHYWQPSATGEAISLHLIATSEVIEGQEHVDQTAGVLREVFQNLPAIYSFGGPPAPWADAKNPGFGKLNDERPSSTGTTHRHEKDGYVIEEGDRFAFRLPELEHPASRMQRLNRLGRMYREGRRIEGMWQKADSLCADDASACGSMAGN